MQTVVEIRELLQAADAEEYAVLARAFKSDTRKGVQNALHAAKKRLEAVEAERARVAELYRFQASLGSGGAILGMDEVGRGPLAGPLTIGGVVLPEEPFILGLNDSKQIPETKRPDIAAEIRKHARAFTIQHIEPAEIDEHGMAICLRIAFTRAIADIDSQGIELETVLLDGNPLRLDPREINVVKGDAKCASIAAASILAKVERDSIMEKYAEMYPSYEFEKNKGYGSSAHIDAISRFGLCPIHRRSYCHFDEQPTLF
ncbi:MAG: ribonuclease HII [Coriobacteriia bacterium]|nr:ribonuclease HII [Coriobacteriia bacterium]